ncbi:MAG: Osmolarity sensory histidine kinase EnvZ [Evtepia sp.]|nr:Osmolarity sensory histidine kinase EnvZ [Evtepia sp.]
MDLNLFNLHQIFDPFPEAVVLLQESRVLFANPAGEALIFIQDKTFLQTLSELLPEQSGDIQYALDAVRLHITISVLEFGKLLILRPISKQETFSAHSNVPSQMRSHLSNLAATTEQLADRLSKEEKLDDYQDLLSIQLQAIYRILRMIHQQELSCDDWEQEYPLGPLDLALCCRVLSYELGAYIAKEGPNVTYRSELSNLFLTGNKKLLEHMVLSLLSNAIKSAGKDGAVELNLIRKKGRVLISVWDSGLAIPEDRLLSLFSNQSASTLPRPNEGAGLDLWIAHRIALFHHGVIMAANRPNGGTEFTVSLPIRAPKQLAAQCDDPHFKNEGFSPLLIGLADALPGQAFRLLVEP